MMVGDLKGLPGANLRADQFMTTASFTKECHDEQFGSFTSLHMYYFISLGPEGEEKTHQT